MKLLRGKRNISLKQGYLLPRSQKCFLLKHLPTQWYEEDFKSFEHEHYFKPVENGTIVIDILRFETPYGLFGKVLNKVYLKHYIEKLIRMHNDVIRSYATGEKWKVVLQNS